jgi:hypothetical protein
MPIKSVWFLIIFAIFGCSRKQENSSSKEFFYIQEDKSKVVTLPRSIRNVQGIFLEKGFTTIVMPDVFFESRSYLLKKDHFHFVSTASFAPDFQLPEWSGYQKDLLAFSEKAVSIQKTIDPSVFFGAELSIGVSQADFISLFSEKYNHPVFIENEIVIVRDVALQWLMRCEFINQKLSSLIIWHQWELKEGSI